MEKQDKIKRFFHELNLNYGLESESEFVFVKECRQTEDVDAGKAEEENLEGDAELDENVDMDEVLVDEEVDEIVDPDDPDNVADVEECIDSIVNHANQVLDEEGEEEHVEDKEPMDEAVENSEVPEGDGNEDETHPLSKEEQKEENSKSKKEKESESGGVVIESVGEVDDDEFVLAVAKFEDDEENEAAKRERKEKRIKEMREVPSKPMHDWILKQFSVARNFSSLYIKHLSTIEVLCDVMYEWASRAIYFCINSERDGKGAAVLHFVTEKECKEAKEALTATLGTDVRIVHPSRHQESDMKKKLSYQMDFPNIASRTLLVEKAPADTTEDQICLLFNGVTSASRLVGEHTVNWQGEDYKLPADIGQAFFVEFGTSKDLKDAVAEGKEYEIAEQKLVVRTTDAYYKAYRDEEGKQREAARKKRREKEDKERKEKLERIKTKVLSDSDRLEKCQQIVDLESKRSQIVNDKIMSYKEKTEQKRILAIEVLSLVKIVEKDTDYRDQLEMSIPEPERQMTSHTRAMWKRSNGRRKREQIEKEKREKFREKDKEKVPEKEKPSTDSPKKEESIQNTVESSPKKISTEDDKKKDTDRKRDSHHRDSHRSSHTSSNRPSGSGSRPIRSRSPGSRRPHDKTSRSPRRRSRSPLSSSKGEKIWDFAVRTLPLTDADRQEIRREMEKMEEDTRGWWHLLIHKPDDPTFQEKDCEKLCSKYGRVMQVHFNAQKIFVRFNSRSAVSAAIRDLWGSKLQIEVPHINDKYKMKNNRGHSEQHSVGSNGGNRLDERGRPRELEHMGRDARSPQADNPLAILAMKQQQAQQQMLIQQQLEEQQAQQQMQASMYMQTALSAMKPPQQHFIQDPAVIAAASMPGIQPPHMGGLVSLNYPLTGTTSVPTYFGPTGVAPLSATGMNYSSQDKRSQAIPRDNLARERQRTPEKRHYERSNPRRMSPERKSYNQEKKDEFPPYASDSKRPRMNPRPGNDNYPYSSAGGPQQRNVTAEDDLHLQALTKTLSSQVEQLTRLTGDPNQAHALKGVLSSILPNTSVSVGNTGYTTQPPISRGVSLLHHPMQQSGLQPPHSQQHGLHRLPGHTGDGLFHQPPTSRLTTTTLHVGGAGTGAAQHLEQTASLLASSGAAARIRVQSGSMQLGIGAPDMRAAPGVASQGIMYPMTSIHGGTVTNLQAAHAVSSLAGLHQQQASMKPPLLTNPAYRYPDEHAFRSGRM